MTLAEDVEELNAAVDNLLTELDEMLMRLLSAGCGLLVKLLEKL